MANKKAASSVDVQIGARVRARRLMLGLSQTELGNKIGVTFQQIQKYERGANRIGGSRMQQLSDALKVTPSFFFGDGNGKQEQIIDIAATLLNRNDCRRMLEAFNQIKTTTARAALIDAAQAYIAAEARK